MAGAGLKALVVVVVLVLVALVVDFNYIGSSLTEQFRFNHLSPLATGVGDKTTPTNNTTTPEEDPPSAPALESSLASPVAPSPAQSPPPRPAEPASSGTDAEAASEKRGPHTEVDCREHGSYCIYTNLCYDGEAFVMLADDSLAAAASGPEVTPLASPPVYRSNRGYFNIEAITYNNPDSVVPRNQRLAARVLPASAVFGPTARQLPLYVDARAPVKSPPGGPLEVIWLDGPFYSQSSDMKGWECWNPWHWSIGTVPLWTDQFINDTFKGGVHHSLYYDPATKKQTKTTGPSFPSEMLLPPMDYVLSLCGAQLTPWMKGLLKSVTASHSKIMLLEHLAAVHPELPDLHKPADTTTYTGIAPILAGGGNLGLAPNKRLLCSEKAVLHTNQYTLFNSILEWRLFRKQVLSRLNLRDLAHENKPPPKVVFKATGRDARNLKELLAVCQSYTTCVMSEPWDFKTPFETQVKDVASAGLFVGVHGAGMTNLMFLPPNGAVIELFPFRWWPDMYRRLANEMGVPYYMVASHDPPKDKIPDNHPCLKVTADQFPYDGCTHKVKYEPFDIPVAQFEATLINALQQIGVNAVPKQHN